MCQRQARVVFEQLDGHHHVPGHRIGVVLVQAQQIAAHGRIQIGGLHVLGQIGLLGTGCTTIVRPPTCRASTFAATTTVLATGLRTAARTVVTICTGTAISESTALAAVGVTAKPIVTNRTAGTVVTTGTARAVITIRLVTGTHGFAVI